MCGISAIVNTRNVPVEALFIRRMNERIAHRGPDNDGVFYGDNFALGHTRLAIMDTGHLAHQPFKYKDYVITYNGEIYNYCEIKNELRLKGYSFGTRCDTEVILAAYDQWGEDCVSKFEGMWSFMIYDPARDILFGSRDRFGQKPFHYMLASGHFVVGSEIKQFLDLPWFRPMLNEEVAFNFLNYGALNYSNDTFFNGVQSLGPGHNIIYNLVSHQFTISRWYNFPEKASLSMDMQEASEQFRQLFTNSITTRLNSDVSMGSCLSGGLDSSSIVCMASNLLNGHGPLPTLSICWNDKAIDEQQYIDEVTSHTGSFNTKIFPDIDQLNEEDLLGKIIYHQDQPIPTASHFSEYKVYEAAKQNQLSVMLDGQGADEYLAGYGLFLWYHMHALFNSSRFGMLSREWDAVKKISHFSNNEMLRNFLFIKYKQKKPRMLEFIEPGWGKEFLNADPSLPPKSTGFSARKLSHHQLFSSSLPYQLHSSDRNSMCHSVEARLPFLDHRLVEFCYSLPDTFKITRGQSKTVLREGLKSILPSMIYERKQKLGFPAPERDWLRRNKDWVNRQIDENADALERFVSIKKFKDHFNGFIDGKHTDSAPFFRVLSFAKWLKVFNVSCAQMAIICIT
jgi:asparagine synthase (glutamine-hydrolysing)